VPRLPVMALIAALVIATSTVMLIRVLPATQFAAPPFLSPGGTFTVTQGTYVVYFYSVNAISVSSNVTADFAFHEEPFPVVVISAPLPPGLRLSISYTGPITGYPYGISVYNDTSIGTIVIEGLSGWQCDTSLFHYDYGAGSGRIPTTVIKYGDLYVAIPRWPPPNWVYTADDKGVYFYDQNGNYIGKCWWAKTLKSTTGYSQSFVVTARTYIFPNGTSVVIAVRPYIMAGVKPSADAQVTITAS